MVLFLCLYLAIIRRMTPLGLQLYNTRRLLSEDNQSVLDDDEYYYRIQEEGILPSQHLRACYSCTVTVANGLFYTFWKGVVQNGLDQLHRERCQQGIQCETQWRRESHAQRLSHIEIDHPYL
ncbi:uncharacterized protein B0P05DRAFT_63101 [Gilbertella persicaria]|uniref:uncharacterized protein n=1 Tax=Gilbertella persicaria TaxID=101096 RepID=UPI00221F9CF6|nr:uncharacterized protein B0P05DRAFT_63101 [Gilbertella persicaria]KAI8081827.1 hypothetical protein B0P05DRAFT_63101 [Gilbertella persicaria]